MQLSFLGETNMTDPDIGSLIFYNSDGVGFYQGQ